MAEVHAFFDALQQISLDMHSQLEKVIKSIETIQGMSFFSGKAAKNAKRYFNELHVTVLTAFQGLFEDLEANVKQHIKTFESEVDDSESTIIISHYLQEVREDIEEIFEKLTREDETIHDIVSGVSDLTSATSSDFSDVNEWKKKAVKETKELEADIHSFTNTGNEIDVQAIMRQIEIVMSKAKSYDIRRAIGKRVGKQMSNEIVVESEKVLDALAEIKSSIQVLDTNFGKVIDGQNNLLLVDKLNQIKESYDELLTKYEALLLQNVSSTEESIKVYQETDENIEARIR